jgi:hypothetical protein
VTAIDIGAAMIDGARRNVPDPTVRFQVSAFEDFTDSGSFDLIVSATAFHWVVLQETTLFGEQDQAGFTADLRRLLESSPCVDLIQETFLAMAPAAARGRPSRALGPGQRAMADSRRPGRARR